MENEDYTLWLLAIADLHTPVKKTPPKPAKPLTGTLADCIKTPTAKRR